VIQLVNITSTPIAASLGGALANYFTVTQICCFDGPRHLARIVAEKRPQILILDLDLVDTIEDLAGMIRPEILWIGITMDYRKGFYALKHSFVDVLQKPVHQNEVMDLLYKMLPKLLVRNRPLTIACPKEVRYLDTESILYLRADNNYVAIHLRDGSQFTVFNTLSHFEDTLYLPFIRVHKSYIVNAQHIRRIHFAKRFLWLDGSELPLPYSTTYANAVGKIDWWKRSDFHF
jgi:DNA-binding LytR/AlgR family response regulator